jgi:LPXTG-motif cell wall-anchored protein
MNGSPMTRTTSADGRWVYTLYMNPGGFPFIHALDTVRGVAHCVGLPIQNQNGLYNIVLSLHGRTLAVHWKSGRPYFVVNAATWRVSPDRGAGLPWLWVAAGGAGAAALAGLAAVLLRRRRREEFEQELVDLFDAAEREVMV